MSEYADEYIRRSHRVNRVSAGEAVRIANNVKASHAKISAILSGLSDDGPRGISRERAIKEISKLLEKQYSDAYVEADKVATEMVKREAEWQTSVLSEYTNATVNIVPYEQAILKSQVTPYQGKTFKDWFKSSGVKAPMKVFGVIESGFLNGQSIPEITKSVFDIAGRATPEIKTLVRSNLLHASSIGRESVADANKDLIDGKTWSSTLDVRTTVNICGVRDQKEYDENNSPIGHGYPWGPGPGQIHFNCRSIQIPKIKGISAAVKRPSVGAGENYRRGDNVTSRGAVRKPTKANRDDGIFKIKQKAAGTDYEKWLRTQKKDFVADALGSKEMAYAFKKGESLDSLVNDPLGLPLLINRL